MSVDKLKKIVLGVTAFSLFLVSGTALADYMNVLNLTEGVTPTSKMVYGLHMLILYIVTAIGVVVFGVSVGLFTITENQKAMLQNNFIIAQPLKLLGPLFLSSYLFLWQSPQPKHLYLWSKLAMQK